MPFMPPPVRDERDGLAAYLAQQQDAFRCVVHGLTDEQAGLTPTPSALSVGALVKHVASVQDNWLGAVAAAPELPVYDVSVEERYAAREAALRWLDGDTLEQVLATFDESCDRVLEAVRTFDLDAPVPVPDAPWYPKDVTAWSVRWVWLHLVEELARHAGHADIIREAVDGATMFELVAARDGLPETPWLKPWRAPSA